MGCDAATTHGAKLSTFFCFFLFISLAHASQTVLSLSPDPPPLDYANPQAPKGGSLTLAGQGSFDSLNPFILRGTAPDTILQIWQPLFKLSDTGSTTEYAELARSVTISGSSVTFNLDPRARFSDGSAVTAADVVWTYKTLITEGLPFYASEYGEVAQAAARDAQTVVFTLKPGAGADAVFNLAGLYVLPEHFWAHRDFASPLRDFPIGSGAYKVSAVAWGGSITYARVENGWSEDIPADQGFYNFDRMTELFFQTDAARLQAFKAGELDAVTEPSAALWARAYDFAAVRDGEVARAFLPETLPSGISGLVFNTRRPELGNPLVRQALVLAYDFEWANRVLFQGAMRRDDSYFSNSAMAARGLPDAAERQCLAPYRGRLPASVYGPPPVPPHTDGSGYNLANLKQAMALLQEAGWHMQNFALVNATGMPMHLEILLGDAADERIVLPYAADLRLLGITVTLRLADPTAYEQRLEHFDFDLTEGDFPVSDDPGSEQAAYWGCAAAATPGSLNLAGVCSPAIDGMIAAEIAAPDAAAKTAAIHALDRLLRNGFYVLPWFHPAGVRVAWWRNRVAMPPAPLQVGVDFSLWWAKK